MKLRIYLLFLLSLFIYSCQPRGPLTLEYPSQLFRIESGIDVLDYLEKPAFIFEFDAWNASKRVNVYVYRYTLIIGGGGIIQGRNNMHYFYAVAFRQNKLIYWGFPDDFSKSEDPDIRKIGENLCDRILLENKH